MPKRARHVVLCMAINMPAISPPGNANEHRSIALEMLCSASMQRVTLAARKGDYLLGVGQHRSAKYIRDSTTNRYRPMSSRTMVCRTIVSLTFRSPRPEPAPVALLQKHTDPAASQSVACSPSLHRRRILQPAGRRPQPKLKSDCSRWHKSRACASRATQQAAFAHAALPGNVIATARRRAQSRGLSATVNSSRSSSSST